MEVLAVIRGRTRPAFTLVPFFSVRLLRLCLLGWVVSWLGFCVNLARLSAAEGEAQLRRAEDEYRTNRVRFLDDPANVKAAWNYARACFDLADLVTDDAQRETIAEQGIRAARESLAHSSNSAEGHYYLALNLGQLARTKALGALKLVREMEREFKSAISLDETIDYAGPHRALGHLYRDAPGWPTSIGNKAKAHEELRHAVDLFPRYPGNRLLLAESFAKWGEKKFLRRELDEIEAILPSARKEFAGEAWAESWREWDKHLQKLQKRAETGTTKSGH